MTHSNRALRWIRLGTNRRIFLSAFKLSISCQRFPKTGVKCSCISRNKYSNRNEVGTAPTRVVLKEFIVGEGVVCRAVSGSYANIAILTSEWPFLPNCLIVLEGQAGGSKPHLASGEKKKNLHSAWERWGRVAFFILNATHTPPWQISKSLGLDQEQVCAAIVTDVPRWIKHLLVSVPDQIAFQKAMLLTVDVCCHGENCLPISLLNKNPQRFSI